MLDEKKVLIVDDNETVLMALEYNLKKAGYLVLKAADGEKAFEIAASEKPHVIVSDVAMPEMDGIELCKKIRSSPRLSEVPFIFLTAHGEPGERIQGLKSGADDYVAKPFDIEELIVRIEILYQKMKKRRFSQTLSGNLRELSIADILQILDQTRKEGNLLISSGPDTGVISIGDGMIMDAAFGDLAGEDALVELLLLKEGTFNYDPGGVSPGKIAKPVSFVMLDVIRLIDEKHALHDFIPAEDRRLLLSGSAAPDFPDAERMLQALHAGPATIREIMQSVGMSRVRVEIVIAKLVREGSITVEDAMEQAVTVARKKGRPVKILFVFTDEPCASAFLKETAEAFHSQSPRGIKASIADFLKMTVADTVVHLFSLRGERKYSFLWEPMLGTSEAVVFLIQSPGDLEHADYLKSRLSALKDIPLSVITTAGPLPGKGVELVEGRRHISEFFVNLLESLDR